MLRTKKIFFLCLSLFGALQAEWTPEYCLSDENLSPLADREYNTLKMQVLKQLTHTWCTKEKINLLMDLVLITRPQVCVEIGAFTGSSILPVAATLKYLGSGKVFAIDAWSNAEAIKYLESDDPNRAWWSQTNMQQALNAYQTLITGWGLHNQCITIQNASEKTYTLVNNIDLLHLDGDYSEKGSLQDVALYLPRVKSGGYILLSNLFTMVKEKAPKMKSYSMLLEACEKVCDIEQDNAILFRKR